MTDRHEDMTGTKRDGDRNRDLQFAQKELILLQVVHIIFRMQFTCGFPFLVAAMFPEVGAIVLQTVYTTHCSGGQPP